MMGTRTGKQCRERDINHLDPDIKRSAWTKQEDDVIRSVFSSVGTRWSQYTEHLPVRSDNAIKNRYHVISRYGMSPRSEVGIPHLAPARATAEEKKIQSESVPTIDADPKQSSTIDVGDGLQANRLKRLHTAREILDQKIRELEVDGAYVSGCSSPSDLSGTNYEETLMTELGPEFEDLDFLHQPLVDAFEQKIGCVLAPELVPNEPLAFDFSCYDIA